MKQYIWNVLNEDLVLKQNVQTCMELISYDSVCVRMKKSKQKYHDQAIEIMTGQAMASWWGSGGGNPHFIRPPLRSICLRKHKMFDFLQKLMATLPTDRLSFGLGSGLIECKLNPVLLLEFDEMQDHWGFFENTGGMQILIATKGSRANTNVFFSGLLEELCHQIE
jgi:hypothetical protein